MRQVTVTDLFNLCKKEITKGNGSRKIVISDDNEGNGFHGLFYQFTEITEEDKDYYSSLIYDSEETDLKKILILG